MPDYVVIARVGDMDWESLLTTESVREALRVFAVLSALVPVALYAYTGAEGGCVLRAEQGIWRVPGASQRWSELSAFAA